MSDENEVKKCPDMRCDKGKIFCEGQRVPCLTCKGWGKGTESFFKKNLEEAEKMRSSFFGESSEDPEKERREFIADACAL